MKLRKKFFVSSKVRYPLALAFIVFPSIALGLIGSFAIAALEDEPLERETDAKIRIEQTTKATWNHVESAIPKIYPIEDFVDHQAEEPFEASRLGKILAKQRAALLRADDQVLYGVLNFRGETLVSSIFVDEASEEQIDPFLLRLIIYDVKALPSHSATLRQVVPISLPHSRQFASKSMMVTFDHQAEAGFNRRLWSAWLISEERLVSAVEDQLSKPQADSEMRYALVSPSAIENTDTRLALYPFDSTLLPGHAVLANVDQTLLPMGGESWRSRFYVVFLVIAVPLLAGILWYIEVVVRREIEDAKNKVDFVANVSHELKTPLTSIRMFIEMLTLGRSQTEEEVQESLQIILRESERLGRLIDRLLNFNRLDRKTKVFEMQTVSLSNILRETVKLFRVDEPSAQDRRIKLAIEPGLPNVEIDRDAIREVILNLLANAEKYSPGDKPIDVHLSQEGRWLLLDVIDHGQGIPLKFHLRIFEKFYRVNDELSRKVEGTGLGLSISQQIAKAHGGNIDVDSALGQGSCFTLRLPVAGYVDPDEEEEA